MGEVVQLRFGRVPGGEVVVVAAHEGAVDGATDRDIEGIRLVEVGEDGPDELEEEKVERRAEVAGQVQLDVGVADGAQVVAEPDADAGGLARLGGLVGRRGGRAGDGSGTGGGGPGRRCRGGRVVRGAVGGDVVRTHEAPDDVQLVLADDEVFEEAVDLDRGGELRLVGGARRGLADVLGSKSEQGEGDGPEVGLGSGCVHEGLHGCRKMVSGPALRPRIVPSLLI